MMTISNFHHLQKSLGVMDQIRPENSHPQDPLDNPPLIRCGFEKNSGLKSRFRAFSAPETPFFRRPSKRPRVIEELQRFYVLGCSKLRGEWPGCLGRKELTYLRVLKKQVFIFLFWNATNMDKDKCLKFFLKVRRVLGEKWTMIPPKMGPIWWTLKIGPYLIILVWASLSIL